MLRVADQLGLAACIEADLDHLPVALVLAEAEQVLRVVIEPEPVLEPGARAVLADAAVQAGAVLGRRLHRPRIAKHVRRETELVVLARLTLVRVGGEQSKRESRVAARARDHLPVPRHQEVAGVVHHTLNRRQAVVVLAVEAQDGLMPLE
jgi:hypothetical protein